jgi:DNA-binding transcriptional MerR regulator
MNKAHTILGVAVAFCVLALIASPVTAALQKGEDSGRWGASGLLDRLEEQGCDVSGIRAAIEAGDQETARTLMQQFMEEHKDELPAPPERAPVQEPGMRITAHLDRLEEQGCDVSGIRAAIEAGDQETARTLMQQFMEEHKDELPAPPEGRPEGHCKRHSTNQETVETDHRLGIIERVPGINPGLSIA